MNNDIIIGRNPVIEALKSEREINKILIANGNKEGSIKKLISMAKDNKVIIQYVDRQKLSSICDGDNHQGVIAYVSAYEYADLEDIVNKKISGDEKMLFVILDDITDPHNLGSILRTCDATNVDAVIIPKRRAVGLNQTVAKTSVGAIEHVPVCRVSNIARTLDYLKENNVWIACADMDGSTYYQADLKGNLGIVMGNEGKGVSRLVKEKCDFTISIPMMGKINSLNVSVATSILLYEAMRQNNEKK